jgi:hypothetical protein
MCSMCSIKDDTHPHVKEHHIKSHHNWATCTQSIDTPAADPADLAPMVHEGAFTAAAAAAPATSYDAGPGSSAAELLSWT